MKYNIRVSNTFERELRRLGHSDRGRVWKAIAEIQDFPYSNKELTGQLADTRSARVGSLRIIYAIDDKGKRIILLHVGYRERVYE